MQFKWHLLFGFVASCVLVFFFNFTLFAGLIIFLSSWMIDGDHYLWYILEMREWSPIKAINWHRKIISKWHSLKSVEREKFKQRVLVCHGILFWIILAGLSFIHNFFLWILIGVAVHMVADWIDLIKRKELIRSKIFPCLMIRRNKNKKGLREL